jgi:hypothetical protein
MIQSCTISHEEHKTIFSDLMFSGMALSYQSEFPTFFSSPTVNSKISQRILPNPTISENDLPGLAIFNLKRGFDETSSLKPSSYSRAAVQMAGQYL